MKTLLAVSVFVSLAVSAQAHDTWVEVNSPEVRAGNVVYVDLRLGNHGNDHRDFKLHSLITLDHATLTVRAPCGCVTDLKPDLIGTAYEPKQGYWTARYTTRAPGLYVVSHELDTIHGTTRAVKSAKTYFVVGADPAAVKRPAVKCDQPLGHPLEIVPLTNPVTESGPDLPLRVRVVFERLPLAGARVSFIPRGQQLAAGFDETFERMTDQNGEASFTPSEANVLLIVVHHPQPARSGDGFQSTHYAATLTVAVPQVPFAAPLTTASVRK